MIILMFRDVGTRVQIQNDYIRGAQKVVTLCIHLQLSNLQLSSSNRYSKLYLQLCRPVAVDLIVNDDANSYTVRVSFIADIQIRAIVYSYNTYILAKDDFQDDFYYAADQPAMCRASTFTTK